MAQFWSLGIVMRRQYKASLKSYIGLGSGAFGLSALLLSPLFIEYPPPKPHDIMLATAMGVGLPVFTFWWLSRFRLTITPTTLSYSGAFSREHTINLADISSTRIILMTSGGAPGFMKLFEVLSTNGTRLRIHYNIFSEEACKDLFKLSTPDNAPEPTPTAP